MIFLAPNVYVLQYLLRTRQVTDDIESRAYTMIQSGDFLHCILHSFLPPLSKPDLISLNLTKECERMRPNNPFGEKHSFPLLFTNLASTPFYVQVVGYKRGSSAFRAFINRNRILFLSTINPLKTVV